MTTPNPLDITGARLTRLVIPLDPDTAEILKEQGIEPPASVALLLKEATHREQKKFRLEQEAGGPAQTDPYAWLAGLLMRRAEPGTDPRVMREVVEQFGDTDTAMLAHAYITGVLPDPKVTAEAVQQTRIGLMNGLLSTVANVARSPSSATSTD